MNTSHVVIHLFKTAVFCFPSTWRIKNPMAAAVSYPKPQQLPSAWSLVIMTYLVLAFMAVGCLEKPAACGGPLSPALPTWSSFPLLLSETTRGPFFFFFFFKPRWLWQIDWSVSLPLEGPFRFFSLFKIFLVSFYQKVSSLQVGAEGDPKASLTTPRGSWLSWDGWVYLLTLVLFYC